MPRVGIEDQPTSTQEWNGLNTLNQTALLLTMPEAGRLTRLWMWAAARNNDVNARLMAWDAAGNVLAQSGIFTLVTAAFSVGVNTKYEFDVETPIDIGSGSDFFVGLSRDPGGEHQFGRTGSGSHRDDTATGSWPQNLAGNVTDSNGQIGAGAEYVTTPQNVWIRRGGVWVRPTSVRVRRGGAWDTLVHGEVKVRRGGGWS